MKELSSNPVLRFFLCQFFHETCEDSLTFGNKLDDPHGPFNSGFSFPFFQKT
jgi:hypothetical protein